MTSGAPSRRTGSRHAADEAEAAAGVRLRVDPIACAGVAVCALVAPGVVALDRWGYPILPGARLDPEETALARLAERACPRHALWLEGDSARTR